MLQDKESYSSIINGDIGDIGVDYKIITLGATNETSK